MAMIDAVERQLLSTARWMFPNGVMYLHNCYALFRYDFSQETTPENTAPLLISADQSYRLYVNGHYVCRGPARGYPSRMPYDRVELLPFLRCGHNFLTVLVHSPGESNFSYQHVSCAGMIAAAEWDNGVRIRSGNAFGWKRKRALEYQPNTAKYSVQMGYQEDYDAARANEDWIFAETLSDDSEPQPLWTQRDGDFAFGGQPYFDMEPRGIPMLDESLHCPEKLVLAGHGLCANGYRGAENISWLFELEEFPKMIWESSLPVGRRNGDWMEFELPASGKGNFQLATLDLGRHYLPGTLLLEIDGGERGDIVDIQYHQLLIDGKIDFVPPGQGSLLATADRLRLGGAHCRHEFYHVMGVRLFSVMARENSGPLRIRTSWRSAIYPLAEKGRFHCGDDVLNGVYEISCHTQKICSLDAMVDTPWREQGQYIGDMRVQSANIRFMSGDSRLIRRGLEMAIRQKIPCGIPVAVAPSLLTAPVLPDFALTWIVCLFDDYEWSGSTEVFREHRKDVQEILDYFEALRSSESGLIVCDSRFWLFEDWGPLPKEPVPTFINLWHVYTLMHYRKLLLAVGDMKEAAELETKISEAKKTIANLLLDRSSGLMKPTLSHEGRAEGEPMVHDQVLALLIGLLPVSEMSAMRRMVRDCLEGTLPQTVLQPSAFWATYLLDAAECLGYQKEALEYLRRNWAKMISGGATWEVLERGNYPGWSYSHAWSAHPAVHLPVLFFGVHPEAPAWRIVRWTPRVFEVPAETSIPSESGLLKLAWTGAEWRAEIPDGMTLKTILPNSGIMESIGPASLKIPFAEKK